MMTAVPPPVLALDDVLALVPDLLSEQAEIPAARIAAPATAIVSSRFTRAPLPDIAVLRGWRTRLGIMRVCRVGQKRFSEKFFPLLESHQLFIAERRAWQMLRLWGEGQLMAML